MFSAARTVGIFPGILSLRFAGAFRFRIAVGIPVLAVIVPGVITAVASGMAVVVPVLVVPVLIVPAGRFFIPILTVIVTVPAIVFVLILIVPIALPVIVQIPVRLQPVRPAAPSVSQQAVEFIHR